MDMETTPVRVLIIEDHGVVREGIKLVLEQCSDIVVAGDAATGIEGVALFEHFAAIDPVDVVVTDLGLTDIDGMEVARRIKMLRPATRVLILSMQVDDQHVRSMLVAGLDGYLLKHIAGRELVEAIRSVMRGEAVISPAVARRLMAQAGRDRRRSRHADVLSEREREVLGLLAGGATSKEVARSLGLRPKTVENHRGHILQKLGVANTAAAITFAYQEGLLDQA